MKMYRCIFVLFMLLSCSSPPSLSVGQAKIVCGKRPTMDEANIAIKSWCRMGLKDPDSAKIDSIVIAGRAQSKADIVYGDFSVQYGWAIIFACNAKNSYGGYTGYQSKAILWNSGHFSWGMTAGNYSICQAPKMIDYDQQ